MSDPGALSPLKQAFLALQASQSRVAELEAAQAEPIAIVGMACRLPGNNPESDDGLKDLWMTLRDAHTTIKPKNIDRWKECGAARSIDSETDALRWGALLEDHGRFDPQFFGISPREATSMDPQQRLLLEVSWHALEHAAIPPESTFGSHTGVYFGLAANDYAQLQLAHLDQAGMEPHFASGVGHSVSSGRISYIFGWHGPSVSIDTACSSSLVAVHLACKALQNGDCTTALAGGVNLILTPESSIAFSRAGMLSSSGRVRAFGLGDGFVRGEGCGVVVLKRLSAARKANDRILGVILGSSVNHDGPGSGLTVPNGQAQAMLLRAALASAGLAPAAVGYVEAHGTGTRLGDPIEAEALGEVFGESPREAPLPIGSVKTNLGHLEAAAGIAGLIKLVLSLGHAECPAQLQDGPLSEHVRWSELPLEVVTQHRPWQPIAGRRIGGVSAFGFSGTNAHVLVEEAPPHTHLQIAPEGEGEVLVLSAKSQAALDRMVAGYIAHLASHPEQSWADVCHTAAVGRTHFRHRIAVVAATVNEGLALLREHIRKQPSQELERGQITSETHSSVGILLRGEPPPDPHGDTRLHRARALAEAYVAGREVDWAAWNQGRVRRRLALPGYPFERQRHWFTPSANQSTPTALPARSHTEPAGRATGHPLLGRQLRLAGDGTRYEQLFFLENNLASAGLQSDHSQGHTSPDNDLAWLREHRIQGRAIMPATAFVEMLLAAGDRLPGIGEPRLEDVVFIAPMPLDSSRLMQVAVDLEPPPPGNLGPDSTAISRARVRVYSTTVPLTDTPQSNASESAAPHSAGIEPTWLLHAEGHVHRRSAYQPSSSDPASPSLDELRARCSEVIEADAFYALMLRRGADFGPRFRGVERVWHRPGEALGQVRIERLGTRLHPASLDACLQVAAAAFPSHNDSGNNENASLAMLPFQVTQLHLISSPTLFETCFVHARLLPSPTPKHIAFNITLLTPTSNHHPIATLNLAFAERHPGNYASKEQHDVADWFYRLRWLQTPIEQAVFNDPGEWLIVLSADFSDDPLLDRLTHHLQSAGQTVAPLRLAEHLPDHRLHDLIAPGTKGVLYLHAPHDAINADVAHTAQTRSQVEELLGITRALTHLESSPPLYVVTRDAYPVAAQTEKIGPLESILCGIAATISAERANLRCIRLDIAKEESVSDAPHIVAELLSRSTETCVAFRAGVRYVQRLEKFPPNLKSYPVHLTFDPREGLNGLEYKPSPRRHPGPMELEIEVRAAALNFHDVLLALGMLSDASVLGVECSGTVTKIGAGVVDHKVGDEVIALAAGTFAHYTIAQQSLTLPKPAALSFAEAASLPVAYLTADRCLNYIASLNAGQSILIHAASGGVGLAAVHLCRRVGATVFATAGSQHKREYLRSLGVQHVMDSRSSEFAQQVIAATAGRGVDIVLNSLAGDLTDAGLSIVAPSGHFIDIGATEIRDAAEMAALYPGLKYHSVDLSFELRNDPSRLRNRLSAILADVAAGHLPSLPLEQLPVTQTLAAFQRMAAAKHIGKIVLIQEAARTKAKLLRIDADASYIVTGGMRGLGLEAVKWLSSRGASSIIVVGRQPPSSETTQTFLALFKTGTVVTIVEGDVSERGIAQRAVDLAGPSLKGIIHCAAVLDDAPIEQQTWDRFARVLAPKADAAWLLHTMTQSVALDFFVLFSSWASIAGSPGAANYCAANMFLDSLAHHRHSLGLAATSINWGAWAETGMAARSSSAASPRNGFRPMSPEAGFEALAMALQSSDEPQVAIADVDWQRSLKLLKQRPISSIYANISLAENPRVASEPKPAVVASSRWLEAVTSAPGSERRRVLAGQIARIVAKTLSLPEGEKIDVSQPLEELGLDSMLAVELRTEIAHVTEMPLPVALLFDYPTIASITGYILDSLESKTQQHVSNSNSDHAPMPSTLVDRIEELSDDEVDRLIQQRQ